MLQFKKQKTVFQYFKHVMQKEIYEIISSINKHGVVWFNQASTYLWKGQIKNTSFQNSLSKICSPLDSEQISILQKSFHSSDDKGLLNQVKSLSLMNSKKNNFFNLQELKKLNIYPGKTVYYTNRYSNEVYTIGDSVTAAWKKGSRFYNATITKIYTNKYNQQIACDVQYEDGDAERKVKLKYIRITHFYEPMIVKEIKHNKLIIVDDLHFGEEILLDINSSLLSRIIPKTIHVHKGDTECEIEAGFANKILTAYAKEQHVRIGYNSISKLFDKDTKNSNVFVVTWKDVNRGEIISTCSDNIKITLCNINNISKDSPNLLQLCDVSNNIQVKLKKYENNISIYSFNNHRDCKDIINLTTHIQKTKGLPCDRKWLFHPCKKESVMKLIRKNTNFALCTNDKKKTIGFQLFENTNFIDSSLQKDACFLICDVLVGGKCSGNVHKPCIKYRTLVDPKNTNKLTKPWVYMETDVDIPYVVIVRK